MRSRSRQTHWDIIFIITCLARMYFYGWQSKGHWNTIKSETKMNFNTKNGNFAANAHKRQSLSISLVSEGMLFRLKYLRVPFQRKLTISYDDHSNAVFLIFDSIYILKWRLNHCAVIQKKYVTYFLHYILSFVIIYSLNHFIFFLWKIAY